MSFIGGSGCNCSDSWSTLDDRREINSNTWGFANKIGPHTFGDYYYTVHDHFDRTCTQYSVTWKISSAEREKFRDNLRSITKILDIAGYILPFAFIAGIIRIIAAKKLGQIVESNIKAGLYVRDLAWEARRTYNDQITRGKLELIPIIGQIINLYLDLDWYTRWNKRPVGNLSLP